jgi:hypothetical protein
MRLSGVLGRELELELGRSALGEALTASGRHDEAETQLINSFRFLSEAGSRHHRRDTAARLVTLYERWGRPEKADDYRRIVESIPPRPHLQPDPRRSPAAGESP